MMAIEADEIAVSVQPQGALGLITLNRPQALNALTWPMIRAIDVALTAWEFDSAIKAVAFTGAGDRAFCAGGDVKAAWHAGMALRRGEAGAQSPDGFFRDEYRLNRRLFHYPKPLIALMNGIVMGGGYGIAGQCRYRIACPRTVFAMPEVGIGFFPDVGSAWHLARMPSFSGFYLGVTGATIPVVDMVFTGTATHVQSDEELRALPIALDRALATGRTLESALNNSTVEAPGRLAMQRSAIEKIFSEKTIEGIVSGLESDGGDFAMETLDLILKRSPTSLHVTLRHLRQAANEEFDAVIARDFQLAQRFMRDSDYYEGVRAVLIDRDGCPGWRPAALADVESKDIEALFQAQGTGLDDILS
jgi:enoyl-CoA hydratase